jgi:hypothetical protein
LLGGEPAWQLLHGLPFAIAGVACAFDVENVSTANVSKTNAAAPTNPLTIANMIAFGYCIVILQFVPTFCASQFPAEQTIMEWQRQAMSVLPAYTHQELQVA